MNKIHVYIFLILLNVISLHAQVFTVSGSITDSSNGEDLIGVNIAAKESPTTGVSTNTFGFYSLSLSEGNYTFIFSYLGYKTITKRIELNKNLKINTSSYNIITFIIPLLIRKSK